MKREKHTLGPPAALSRRAFLKRGAAGALAAGAAFSIGTSQVLDVTRLDAPIKGLGKEFEGFRIAFASDFHYGPNLSIDRVRRVVGEINAFESDVVLLGGDYALDEDDYYATLMAELSQLSALHGIYSVPGNHEYWDGIMKYRKWLSGTAIRDLTNKGFAVERGGSALYIAGVDDEWCGRAEPQAALAAAPAGAAKVVFTHNPSLIRVLPSGYADLILAGHTHGRQVYLPFVIDLVTPAPIRTPYRAGLYRTAAGPLYVTRGVGMTLLPVRLWCRPEIVLITLCAA